MSCISPRIQTNWIIKKPKAFSLDEGETLDKNKILSVNAYVVDDNFEKKVY